MPHWVPPLRSLAAQITVPFVALFGLLLLALGFILAREILSEVEARVENDQRLVLEVLAFPDWPLGEQWLVRVRDMSGPRVDSKGSGGSEFIVLQSGSSPLTTLARDEPAGRALFDAFLAELNAHPELEPSVNEIRRGRVRLNDRDYLLLCTARTRKTSGAPAQRFFLLHPYAEIEQAKNRALWRIVGLGAAGLGLAAALGLALAYWIARPVRKLAAAAKRVTTAGLNDALDSALVENSGNSSGSEIAELTRAFRSMIESLRRSQADVLKAERLAATGKLAACVAHEIRNPLTSLRMTVQMLQSASADGSALGTQHSALDVKEAYRVILSEIDRLSLAVEELLTFARPLPPQKTPSDLNKLCAETLQFLERQLAHAKVRTALESDAALPPDLNFDPNKLRQLLVNLILNAQQALVRGGDVIVRTKWNGETRRAVLEVQDSGPGVPSEIRDRVFELFASTKPGGGGLGLTVAKQIAEEHGGTIGFESAPGKTVFRVELPG